MLRIIILIWTKTTLHKMSKERSLWYVACSWMAKSFPHFKSKMFISKTMNLLRLMTMKGYKNSQFSQDCHAIEFNNLYLMKSMDLLKFKALWWIRLKWWRNKRKSWWVSFEKKILISAKMRKTSKMRYIWRLVIKAVSPKDKTWFRSSQNSCCRGS